jgi:hypothetical protein
MDLLECAADIWRFRDRRRHRDQSESHHERC